MNKIETGSQNPIKGLTVDQADISVYDFYDRDFAKWFPSDSDFYMAASEARRKKLGNKENQKHPLHFHDIKKSLELIAFLETTRPPTLFFQPQDIASLLTPDSDLIVNHEKIEEFETWQFVLNPNKHKVSDDLHRPDHKQTITLTRGARKHGRSEPYLVVGFPANYDGSHVIFCPEIKITYGDFVPRDEIEKAMIKLLGLQGRRVVSQQLSFAVKKEPWKQIRRNSSGQEVVDRQWYTYPVEIGLKK